MASVGPEKLTDTNAEDIGRRTFSIPLSAALDDQDVEDVITAVRRIALANAAH